MEKDMMGLAVKGFVALMGLSVVFFMDGILARVGQLLLGVVSITFLVGIFIVLTMQSGSFDSEIAKKLLILRIRKSK